MEEESSSPISQSSFLVLFSGRCRCSDAYFISLQRTTSAHPQPPHCSRLASLLICHNAICIIITLSKVFLSCFVKIVSAQAFCSYYFKRNCRTRFSFVLVVDQLCSYFLHPSSFAVCYSYPGLHETAQVLKREATLPDLKPAATPLSTPTNRKVFSVSRFNV